MSRKKTLCHSEVVDCRDNTGYRVFNRRNHKLHPHRFASRLEALDFANEITFRGTRAAYAALEQHLQEKARTEEYLAIAKREAARAASVACANTGSKCQAKPLVEHASREDITAAYGERVYWEAEVTRLTRVCALPTSNRRTALHNRMALMNAQSMLADITAR
jgi:hypothetical protein